MSRWCGGAIGTQQMEASVDIIAHLCKNGTRRTHFNRRVPYRVLAWGDFSTHFGADSKSTPFELRNLHISLFRKQYSIYHERWHINTVHTESDSCSSVIKRFINSVSAVSKVVTFRHFILLFCSLYSTVVIGLCNADFGVFSNRIVNDTILGKCLNKWLMLMSLF